MSLGKPFAAVHLIITTTTVMILKGAFPDFFYHLLIALPAISWSGKGIIMCKSCATIWRLPCATCHVPHATKGQLSYQVWQSWNCIYVSSISLAETINQRKRGENQSALRKPLMTSFRKSHILKSENSSPTETRTCTLALAVGTCWESRYAYMCIYCVCMYFMTMYCAVRITLVSNCAI